MVSLANLVFLCCHCAAGETPPKNAAEGSSIAWQEKAVEYARIMSRVKWTPVADGMPRRGGTFKARTEYTGVPYSSVKSVGRYIGFDIFLKTFLAAVENPQSVLYTENLYGEVKNAECYYGKVCSSYTSYALQCGIWYLSRINGPPYRDGVTLVDGQSAQFARVGDIIVTPPSPGSHIELVTEITRNDEGRVTHIRIEESRPQTTKNTNRSAAEFDSHLAKKSKKLYRINDLDVWRNDNRAESFLFPNYAEDSATPVINRVLLLDRGDWVAYQKGQPVKFNVMDRDAEGVKALVIKRGESIVQQIPNPGKGVIERTLSECGDYTAHCIMQNDTLSQACEFSVCDLNFAPPAEVDLGEPWELEFSSDNMNIILVYFRSSANSYAQPMVFLSDEDRRDGKVTIPSDLIRDKGNTQVWLIGENQFGRLKLRKDFSVK
jgi:hypothetical protein